MSYRTQYATHGDLLPDLLDTVDRLHADDGQKRLVFTRPGAIPISVRVQDNDPNAAACIIDALANARITDHDVTVLLFHNADGIQRTLGWKLHRDLVVEIVPVAKLAELLPVVQRGQFRTLAERRLDFGAQ